MISDDEIRNLVERAKKYDSDAFGKLYDLYFNKIYAYIFYRVGYVDEAEDLSEQVFLKALEAIRSFDWRGIPFSAWLFRIAHNLVIDRYRRNYKMTNISIDEISPIASEIETPEKLTIDKLSQEKLHVAISHLTKDQQQVIILKFFSNLSNTEIAQFLDKPVGAVKSLQHRALNSLKRILKGGLTDG
jgi:RNA polymerase sigma-70 factor (ECF subfamily)